LQKQSLEFNWGQFSERYLNQAGFKELLRNRGYPAEAIYLLLFPFAVYGKRPDADFILEKAQSTISGS